MKGGTSMRQDQADPDRERAEDGPPEGSDATTRQEGAPGSPAPIAATTKWVDGVFARLARQDAKDLARAEREAQSSGKEPFSYARLTELLGQEPPDYEPQIRLRYYVGSSGVQTLAQFAEKLREVHTWDTGQPLVGAREKRNSLGPVQPSPPASPPPRGEPPRKEGSSNTANLLVDTAIREALQALADQRAQVDADAVYPQHMGVEIIAFEGDRAHRTVHFLFDNLVSRLAQSGSDWYEHFVYHGTAVFGDGVLINASFEEHFTYLTEWAEPDYDRERAVRLVRDDLRARLVQDP